LLVVDKVNVNMSDHTPKESSWKPNVKAKEWTPTEAAIAATSNYIISTNQNQINETSISEDESMENNYEHDSIKTVQVESKAEEISAGKNVPKNGISNDCSKKNESAENSKTLDETENLRYDIARLLSLRPKSENVSKPSKLNLPPELNILKDFGSETPQILSNRSFTSGGGSGFTTPRSEIMSRPNSSRNLSRQASRNSNRPDYMDRRGKNSSEILPQNGNIEALKINDETRWKAKHMTSEENGNSEEENIFRKAISLLNKMTIEKFEKLSEKFVNVGLNSVDIVDRIISVLVTKAQGEAHFSPMYAQLCLKLSEAHLPAFNGMNDGKKVFRKMLLEHCQREFGKDKSALIQAIKDDSGLEPEEKLEKEIITKRHYAGHMRFVGELYKVGILREKSIHSAVSELLNFNENGESSDKVPEEENLECLVKLLSTVGKMMQATQKESYKSMFNSYFVEISRLSKDSKNVSSRLRFMLRDLIDLKRNNWVPRRVEEKAKTFAQIHSEVAKEEEEKARKGGGESRRSLSRNASIGNISIQSSQDVRNFGPNSSRSMASVQSTPRPQKQKKVEDGWEKVGPSSTRSSASFQATPKSQKQKGNEDGWETVQTKTKKSSSQYFPTKSASSRTNSERKVNVSSTPRNSKPQGSLAASDSNNKFKKPAKAENEKEKRKKVKQPLGKDKVLSDAKADEKSDKSNNKNVTEQKARKVAQCAIDEFVTNGDLNEALECMHELNCPQFHWAMVHEIFQSAIEGNDTKRNATLSVLLKAGFTQKLEGDQSNENWHFISTDEMIKGCTKVINLVADLIIDTPHIITHASKMLGAMFVSEILPIQMLSPKFMKENMPDLISSCTAQKVVVNILGQVFLNFDGKTEAYDDWIRKANPPLEPTQLAQLMYEEERMPTNYEIEEVKGLLKACNLPLQ